MELSVVGAATNVLKSGYRFVSHLRKDVIDEKTRKVKLATDAALAGLGVATVAVTVAAAPVAIPIIGAVSSGILTLEKSRSAARAFAATNPAILIEQKIAKIRAAMKNLGTQVLDDWRKTALGQNQIAEYLNGIAHTREVFDEKIQKALGKQDAQLANYYKLQKAKEISKLQKIWDESGHNIQTIPDKELLKHIPAQVIYQRINNSKFKNTYRRLLNLQESVEILKHALPEIKRDQQTLEKIAQLQQQIEQCQDKDKVEKLKKEKETLELHFKTKASEILKVKIKDLKEKIKHEYTISPERRDVRITDQLRHELKVCQAELNQLTGKKLIKKQRAKALYASYATVSQGVTTAGFILSAVALPAGVIMLACTALTDIAVIAFKKRYSITRFFDKMNARLSHKVMQKFGGEDPSISPPSQTLQQVLSADQFSDLYQKYIIDYQKPQAEKFYDFVDNEVLFEETEAITVINSYRKMLNELHIDPKTLHTPAPIPSEAQQPAEARTAPQTLKTELQSEEAPPKNQLR